MVIQYAATDTTMERLHIEVAFCRTQEVKMDYQELRDLVELKSENPVVSYLCNLLNAVLLTNGELREVLLETAIRGRRI